MQEQRKIKHTAPGDRAVDGLFAGLLSGIGMALLLVIAGAATGNSPAEVLGTFSPGRDGNPAIGAAAHLAVSGLYGLTFAILAGYLKSWAPLWAPGMVYGLVLFGLAALSRLPGSALNPTAFLLAHLLYGGLLGWRLSRIWRGR